MTTAIKLTPGDVDRLQELLKAAADHAVADATRSRLASGLEEHVDEWTEGLGHFESAVHARSGTRSTTRRRRTTSTRSTAANRSGTRSTSSSSRWSGTR